MPKPRLDRSNIYSAFRVEKRERLPEPVEDGALADGVRCTAPAFSVEALTAVDARPQGESLDDTQHVAVGLAVFGGEDQTCMWIAQTAGFEALD